MKYILITIVLTSFAHLAFSQDSLRTVTVPRDSLTTNTSIGMSFRGYAPAFGSVINQNPVVEFQQLFAFSKAKFLVIKSVDVVDPESAGNYLFGCVNYSIVSDNKKNIWIAANIVIPEMHYVPKGAPITFFQTGISTKRKSINGGIAFTASKVLSEDAEMVYLIKPSLNIVTRQKAKINIDAWLSNSHWTVGFCWTSPAIELKTGSLYLNFLYNYRDAWSDGNKDVKDGMVDFGISYSL